MKALSGEWIAANNSRSASARYVMRLAFNATETDLYYFPSHSDIELPAGALSQTGRVKIVSSTSQEIDLESGRSTIGELTFELQDKDGAITALFYSKLNAGDGLRGKTVRFYYGYSGLSWLANYDGREIITQIIERAEIDKGIYRIFCSDVQRLAREKIIILKTATLAVDISATGTPATITIYGDTAPFPMFAHGANYQDAPSQTVGYVKIGNEVFRYTAKPSSTTFGGTITRARFGTVAEEHKSGTSADTRQRKLVEEYFYWEGPAIKAIRALYTGFGGMPTHWHAGMSTALINTTEWENIGTDIYDTANDAKGVQCYLAGLKRIDAKTFVETELNKIAGVFQLARGNGKLGLIRLTGIHQHAPSLGVLDERDAISLTALKHQMHRVANIFDVKWNYDDTVQKDYTRRNSVTDSNSLVTHGKGTTKTLALRALHGSLHTLDTLNWIFTTYREAFAGPPLEIETELARPRNVIEVGDVWTIKIENIKDMNTGQSLYRSYMAMRVSVDWMRGVVSVRWFGSSARAAPLALFSDASVLPDSHYSGGSGTALSAYLAANYPGQYTEVGSAITITGSVTLTGATTVAAGRYYYPGSVTLNDGANLLLTQNVMIAARDPITFNGYVGGVGTGLPGAASGAPTRGTPGYVGTTAGGGSIFHVLSEISGTSQTQFHIYSGNAFDTSDAVSDHSTFGQNTVIPTNLNIKWDGANITGIPTDLRPTSGGTGGMSHYFSPDTDQVLNYGGAGGAGGASLVTVSRGCTIGPSGRIDLSGAPGSQGGGSTVLRINGDNYYAYSGTGAGGAPGIFLCLLDGANVAVPTVAGRVVSKQGESPAPGGTEHLSGPDLTEPNAVKYTSHVWSNETTQVTGDSLVRILHIPPNVAAVPDVSITLVNPPTGLTLASGNAELLKLTDGTVVPRIKVSWTPSTTEGVKGVRLEWKPSASSNYTVFSGLIPVGVTETWIADGIKSGVEYDVRIKAVNRFEYESAYATVTAYTVLGLTDEPPDCTGLTVISLPDGTRRLTPSYASRPADFAGFNFRYVLGTGGTWAGMAAINMLPVYDIPYETFEPRPEGTYTFGVKMVDRTGNESTNAATVEAKILPSRVDIHTFMASNWSERTNPKNVTLNSVAWSGSLFVAVGEPDGTDAYIITSPDGITWTERANPKNLNLYSITWSGSLFVAVGLADGADSYLITSLDGITWTERTNPKNLTLFSVTWSGSIFVAVGGPDATDVYIITSPDGITWIDRISPKRRYLFSIIWADAQFVSVGPADGTDAFIINSLYFKQ